VRSERLDQENEARLYREKERLLARMVAARMWDVFSNSPPGTPAANTDTQPSRRNPGLAGAGLSRSQAPLTYGHVPVDDRRGKVRSPQQERRNKSQIQVLGLQALAATLTSPLVADVLRPRQHRQRRDPRRQANNPYGKEQIGWKQRIGPNSRKR
jgi:hypothetical protein